MGGLCGQIMLRQHGEGRPLPPCRQWSAALVHLPEGRWLLACQDKVRESTTVVSEPGPRSQCPCPWIRPSMGRP